MDPSILDQAGSAYTPSNVSTLRSQLNIAESDLAKQNGSGLGPNNPKEKGIRDQITELKKQIAVEEARILSESKQAYLAAQAQENQTNAALDNAKAEAYKLRDDLLKYTLQAHNYEADRTLYDGLLQRLRTAGVEAGLESTEIDIVDPAVPRARSHTQVQDDHLHHRHLCHAHRRYHPCLPPGEPGHWPAVCRRN